jgi:predicted NUDIX family NTP pyrophosphohydrolase
MVSAGLLMFRYKGDILEVLLVHPGGPFFQNKDDGVWTIPKGEIGDDEDLVSRAKVEFEEELGIIPPAAKLIKLGCVKQKGGKKVHGWAFEGDLKDDFTLRSNTFELEWPPHSGKLERFPEVDRAAFFPIEVARANMNAAQRVFLERLIDLLARGSNSNEQAIIR